MALKPISKIAAGVQASTTLAIDSLFKQMKAEGKDVVGFGAGEPDFPTPEHIKQAGIEAIENNQTKYTPAAGLMDLRKAACYRLKEDCGLDYEPTQIVVASGAKHSVYIALMALCNPGDEVVIAAPYWVSYSEMVKQAGAVPVIVAATEEADFKITAEQLDAAITDNTKVFMLNSPSNPTGMVYTRKELEARNEVKWETYTKKIQIEARVLGDLAMNHIIPVATEYQSKLIDNVYKMKELFPAEKASQLSAENMKLIEEIARRTIFITEHVNAMVEARKVANKIESEREKAIAYHDTIAPMLEEIRYHIDKLELIVDNQMWTLPKYRELLFIR